MSIRLGHRWTHKPPPGTPLDRAHPRAQGLAAWWPMNEGGGAPVDLMSGVAAGRSGLPAWTPGRWGPSLLFSVSNNLSVPNRPAISISGDISFSAWVKFAGSGAYGLYGGYDTSDPYTGVGLSFGVTGGGKFGYWSSANGAWVEGSSACNDGAWHHVGVRVLGTTAAFYFDGRPDGTAATAGAVPWTGTKRIGSSSDDGNPYPGQLEDFRIYNRALSAGEFADIYSDPFGLLLAPAVRRFVFFAGSTTASGALALASVSTLGASGSAASSGAAALSGASTLAGTGTATASGALGLASVSTLAGAGSSTASGSLALACVATFSVDTSGGTVVSGALALACSSSLTASGSATASGASAMAGVSTFSGSGSAAASGSLPIAGISTLTGSGTARASGAVGFAAVSTLRISTDSGQTSVVIGRDDLLVEAVADALDGTGLFSRVIVGARPEEQPVPAGEGWAVAWVWWSDASEEPADFIGPGAGFVRSDRTVSIGLTFEVRAKDGGDRMRRLARLDGQVRKAIRSSPLGGFASPHRVTFGRFRRDVSIRPPSARVLATMQAVYSVDGYEGYDAADREVNW